MADPMASSTHLKDTASFVLSEKSFVQSKKMGAPIVEYNGLIVSQGVSKERVTLAGNRIASVAGRILPKEGEKSSLSLSERIFCRALEIENEKGEKITVVVNINSFKKRLLAAGVEEEKISGALSEGKVSSELLSTLSKDPLSNRDENVVEIKSNKKSLFLIFHQIFETFVSPSKDSVLLEKNLQRLDDDKLNIMHARKVLRAASKQLTKGESKKIDIKEGKRDHHFVVSRDKSGKIDVLIQEKLLGKGTFGEVFQVRSLLTNEDFALKFESVKTKPEGWPQDNDGGSLDNEVEMLSLLNGNGPHEGVQEMISVSQINPVEGKTIQKVTKGKIYSGGDLQSAVEYLRMEKHLGLGSSGVNKLSQLSESQIQELARQKIEVFLVNLTELAAQKRKLLELKKTPELSKEKLNEIHEEISLVNQSINLLLEENNFLSLFSCLNENNDIELYNQVFYQNIRSFFLSSSGTEPFQISEKHKTVLITGLSEAVRQVQVFSEIDLSKRLAMAANLVEGMRFTHKQGIVHGDIKPANCFRNATQAVLADFGGAKSKKKLGDVETTRTYSPITFLIAMTHYRNNNNPENWMRAGRGLDMHAMGLSLYELLTGNSIPERKEGDAGFPDRVRRELEREGLAHEAAAIIAKMVTPPIPFDLKNPPKGEFPLPISDTELKTLIGLLNSKNLLLVADDSDLAEVVM